MSMNFDKPVNSEAMEALSKMFGEPVAQDEKTFLYDKMDAINGAMMSELANKAKQTVALEINAPDDIKTMSDGTQYRMTPRGWIKVTPNVI